VFKSVSLQCMSFLELHFTPKFLIDVGTIVDKNRVTVFLCRKLSLPMSIGLFTMV
jgi:hypothetical protein